MSRQIEPKRSPILMDKAYARQLADKLNARLGIVLDPNATAEQAQQLSLASGVRPENNELSRDIIRNRECNLPD